MQDKGMLWQHGMYKSFATQRKQTRSGYLVYVITQQRSVESNLPTDVNRGKRLGKRSRDKFFVMQ